MPIPTQNTRPEPSPKSHAPGITKRPRDFWAAHGLTALVLTGVLARLMFVAIPGNDLRTPWSGGGDTHAYVTLAQNLVFHRGYTYAGQPTAFRPPGYPLLLAAFMDVFGNHYVAAVRALQFFEGLLIAALCAAMARRIFGKAAGSATLVIALFLPTLVEMTGEILTEATATVFVTVFLYCLMRYYEKPGWKFLTGMSIAVGVGALERSNLAFLGLVVLAVILLREHGKRMLRGIAIAVVVPFILISPWVLRTFIAFHGDALFSTQAGFAAASSVLDAQGRAVPGGLDKVQAAVGVNMSDLETNDPVRLQLPSEPEINRRCWQVAFRVWRETGWGLIPVTLKKLSYFWLSTDQLFWTGFLSRSQRAVRATGVFAYLAVLALAIAGWFHLRAMKPALAQAFLLYAALVTVLHFPFNMNTRYRMIFMDPLLAVLGGNTTVLVMRRLRNGTVPEPLHEA